MASDLKKRWRPLQIPPLTESLLDPPKSVLHLCMLPLGDSHSTVCQMSCLQGKRTQSVNINITVYVERGRDVFQNLFTCNVNGPCLFRVINLGRDNFGNPIFQKGLTKLAILLDYKCPRMLCLALPTCQKLDLILLKKRF